MDMDRYKALKILEIPFSDILTDDIIKKHYRIMALKFHPDKNKQEDACLKFQQINSAYEFLNNNKDNNNLYDSYDSLLNIFINEIFDNDFHKHIIYILIKKILNKASNKLIDYSLNFLERIDISILKKINDFLKFYSDIFQSLLSIEITDKINEIIEKKEKLDKMKEYIILHPLLDDLFDNNLYRLVERDNIILVPLWHHELIYDISGIELYIECYPILPENIIIDENNNIYIYLKYILKDIWSLEYVIINLGKREFRIERNKLLLMNIQKFVFQNEGISRINEHDIYDIGEKSDIIVNIEII
jgi:hypothetical protein